MSAGRKKGDNLDRYDTPPEVTRLFLREWCESVPEIEGLQESCAILEPAAGSGSMIAPLREAWPEADVLAIDIEPRNEGIRQRDFLDTYDIHADIIFSNPPFRLAEQFVRHAMATVSPEGWVVMLLRAGFLESKVRRDLFEAHPLESVWFLRSRPHFTGPNTHGGTDTAMYAWFVWRNSEFRPSSFEGHIL